MHMVFEDENKVMLIGFVIVLIVGINIILFFGNVSGFGGNTLAGATTFNCEDVANGIKCGNDVFAATSGSCPAGDVKICANSCTLAKIYTDNGRTCPTACEYICAPKEILEKI